MPETHTLGEFRAKFRVDELLVAKTNAWSWSVRPDQPTLGAGILSLNRFALRLSEVTPAEMAELGELIATLERAVKQAFPSYDIMNYLMLMMKDHYVHYHVVPRYPSPCTFMGLTWMDNGGRPGLPALGERQHKDREDVLQGIQKALRDALEVDVR